MKFTLTYLTSSGMELSSLGISVRSLKKMNMKCEVFARNSAQLQNQEMAAMALEKALSSSAVVVNLHGSKASCPIFDELIKGLNALPSKQRPYLHIEPTPGDDDSLEAAREFSPHYGHEQWNTIHKYLLYGGAHNMQNLILYLAETLGFQLPRPPQPPASVPTEGIYHPEIQGIPSLDTYLSQKVVPGRPTVGLWFYQTYWLNGNIHFIDALIREIEANGANVIPVFHQRFKDNERGNKGADDIVGQYFMDGKQARIDVLINPMLFSLKMAGNMYEGLLERLDVPVIQAMVSLGSRNDWMKSSHGLSFMDVTYNAAQPEMDGALITVPVATREVGGIDPVTGAEIVQYMPVEERLKKLVRMALRWANLRRLPAHKKRIAIVFHHYPPRDDRVGCAVGLDSFTSVKNLLDAMKSAGYWVEEDIESGERLKDILLQGVTTDTRWTEPRKMASLARISCPAREYAEWFSGLPEDVKNRMREVWGEPPGTHMVYGDKILIPGFLNGNIFITIQPSRGSIEKAKEQCHDPWLPPPHSYLAQYWWMANVFKADAVIHVGKHGTLEWLPGKALGLSNSCYPDITIDEIPNIYPYIINDPSEGTQAKRRSYACIIDHLTPVYTNADLYDQLARLDHLLTEYSDTKREDPEKAKVLMSMIWEAVEEADLHHDLNITRQKALENFEAFLDLLHEYLLELADTMIADGLHILGEPPDGKRLVEFIVQLLRFDIGKIPSLRTICAKELGYSEEFISGRTKSRGKELRRAVELAHNKAVSVIEDLLKLGANHEAISIVLSRHFSKEIMPQAQKTLQFVVDELVPAIKSTRDEISACIKALSGRFVPPGPSGAPTKGQADILPTGRNFYSVDPTKIPTQAAWERGKRMGEALLKRYLDEQGTYPSTIGIVVYGGPTMRTRGEDVAEILWLMGVRPVWHKTNQKVIGIELISLEELGRPRLDVVPRVSGFFRDAFPNLMELMDEAASMVAALKEPPSQNILRKNVLRDVEHYMRSGMTEEKAWRIATLRVFGCPPGTYGAGVAELVEAKQWKERDDLGAAYIKYSAHAYGKGSYGTVQVEAFKRLLSRMDVTVKNEDSREYDMMSCTDYFNYYGGLIAAVGSVRGDLPSSYMGDSHDPNMPKIRSTKEEAIHVLRARLINPKWLKGMMRHGYKGAGDISHMMDVVFGWDATANVIEDWMYERIASSYCLDEKMREWMKNVNPHALYNILDKLLEAISRGMWRADQDMATRLRDMYLEMEGEMEERSG